MNTIRVLLSALRRVAEPSFPPGPIPYALGGMPSQEWLAPHLVRLPGIPSAEEKTSDA